MATLASDDFNRADADALGSNWTEETQDWDIVSNKARATLPGTSVAYWSGAFNPASADYDVQGLVQKTGDVGASGLIGRRTGADTYYVLYINTFSQLLVLSKIVAGVETELGTFNGGYANNTDYTIKLSMSGTTIKGFEGGVERISVTDSAISAIGKPGIWSDDDGALSDDFLVTGTEAVVAVLRTLPVLNAGR